MVFSYGTDPSGKQFDWRPRPGCDLVIFSLHTISFAINYWSKGEVQANFLRHEGYLGAIGAFLKSAESFKTENYSWGENLYGSSAFQVESVGQLVVRLV